MNNQKKAGRPKIPKEHARYPGISVRLTPTELDVIKAAITKSKLKQSDWARKSLLYVALGDIRIT